MRTIAMLPSDTRLGQALRLTLCPRRWFWAGLFVLHLAALPALLATLAGSGTIAEGLGIALRLLGLSASAAFFVLKLIDVPWLRLPAGWHGRIATLIIIGLLHWGVIQRVAADDKSIAAAPWSVVLALGGGPHASRAFGLRPSLLVRLQARHVDFAVPRRTAAWAHPSWLERFRLPQSIFALCVATPRAPPVH